MITKLTKEKEARIPEFIDKWVGMVSKPMNHEKAIKAVKAIYKSMGEDDPIVIIGDSPRSTAIMCALCRCVVDGEADLHLKLGSELYSKLDAKLHSELFSKLNSKLNSKLKSELDSELDSELYSKIDSELFSKIDSKLNSELFSKIGSKLNSELDSELFSMLNSKLSLELDSELDSELYSKIDSELFSKIDSELYSKLDSELKEVNQAWYLSVWWLRWCGWYDYGRYIGVKFDENNYNLFMDFNSEVNFIIPYKGIAFISEKPTEIKWMGDKLHCDGGAAVRYKDGYSLYSLNGITVPEYLAVTPGSELDIKFFQEEKNADVKAEFIRKYGIERMLEYGKLIDTYKNYNCKWWMESEYEVWDMTKMYEGISKHSQCAFLKMKNQTTGIWHLEGINPNFGKIKTIKQALDIREKIMQDNIKEILWIA